MIQSHEHVVPVVEVSVVRGVATVTLNRPQVRNALTALLIRQLRTAMSRLDRDPVVRAVILTGAGSAFCAGLDMNELHGTGENLRETAPDRAGGRPWPPLSKPVIGAINGPAYTGGLEIALNCDLLVAAEEAVFADTHARVGVMPGWGLSVLLPAGVGEYVARAMSFTGMPLDAHAALRLGLVVGVVPREHLVPRAHELAAGIVAADAAAISALQTTYRATSGLNRREALRVEHECGQRWLASRATPVRDVRER